MYLEIQLGSKKV